MDQTWSFQRSGRGCHKVPHLWVSRSFLRGICQWGAVTRSISSGNQVWVGQYGATSRICSSSSLILHSVCARRLTGGNAYLQRPRGQLCVSASVPSVPPSGSKTTDSEKSLGTQTGLPVRVRKHLQISLTIWGWSLHSPGSAASDSSLAARLSKPGMWMARTDLRCLGL